LKVDWYCVALAFQKSEFVLRAMVSKSQLAPAESSRNNGSRRFKSI